MTPGPVVIRTVTTVGRFLSRVSCLPSYVFLAKGTMGYSGSRSLIEALGVSAAKREISQTNLFMPSLFLLVNNLILNPPPNSFYP